MSRKQLSEKLKDISTSERARRWESGRLGKGGGGKEVADSDAERNGIWYDRTETGESQVGE